MRVVLFIITAFWFFPVSTQTLQIMGSNEGFLPFYYGKGLNEGILVEVIKDFSMETGIEADFRPMARKRQIWALQRGLANAVFASPHRMPLPDQMHAVGPVLTWRDRVFAQPGMPTDSFDDVSGSICLRRWFVYSDQLERRIGT